MWPEGEHEDARLGLAVSGGPDSLALLLLAAVALPGRVEAASVDHGLRPESVAEIQMVAQVCAELGVPQETLAVTLPAGNVQDRARAARYGALNEWCGRRGLGALATGHQLDDQAETLVMRLNRGSGLAGLAGVRARGSVPGGELPLLRPLLDWRRAELAEVVAAAGLEAAQDASNEDERFDRIRIRRALKDADWIEPVGLARSAALLTEAERLVKEAVGEMWRTRVQMQEGNVVLAPPTSDFAAVELVRQIIQRLGGDVDRNYSAGVVERLRRGENASLAGVLVRAVGGEWVFAPEPPRSA